MTRRIVLALTVLAAVAVVASPALMAHPGHDHKVLGTLTMTASDHVMLKDKDGKDHTIQVNADTKFTRAKKVMTAADMKVGMRVVVTAETGENDTLVAKAIELGPAPATK